MSQARFRQIARLEKLAQPYLKARRHAEEKWKWTRKCSYSCLSHPLRKSKNRRTVVLCMPKLQ